MARSCFWPPGRPICAAHPLPPTPYHPLQEQAIGLAQLLQEGCVPQPPFWVPAEGKVVELRPGGHPAHLPSQLGPQPTQL